MSKKTQYRIEVKVGGQWKPLGDRTYTTRGEAERMLVIACPLVLNDDEKRIREVTNESVVGATSSNRPGTERYVS